MPVPRASTIDLAKRLHIEPKLLTNRRRTDAIVVFKDAENEGIASAAAALDAAEAMARGADRRQLVYNTLSTMTERSRSEALPPALLGDLHAAGKLDGVDTLWSMNAVRLRGVTPAALKRIAGPNITAIVADEKIKLPLPNGYTDAVDGASQVTDPLAGDDTTYIDWGVRKMNAPAAWQQGITGAGITVASLDTGVITDHPGLRANYRGTRPDGTQDHNYNWYNGVEKGGTYPIDDVGHGTHTVGNAVGYEQRNLIGVAPDAKMIAGRGLGQAGGTIFSLMGGMEWMMAPTDLKGEHPRPDLAPDIVTNSWGGANISNPFMWAELRNWRRAGIIPLFAAGNTGKRPETPDGAVVGSVSSPGLYGETITVGASDKDDSRAYFSNRGPSLYATGVKPEITAPGVKVYSAWVDGTFRDTFIIDGHEYPASGTSMATPHAAGAAALYLQAHPNASFDDVRDALAHSATDPSHPNDDTGYGRVQVDRLIAPGTIDPNAKLAPKERVDELVNAAARAKVFGEKD